MADNGNVKLNSVDTQDLVDEVLSRSDLDPDQQNKVRIRLMQSCGYSVKPAFYKPDPKNKKRNPLDDSDDDWDL